MRQEQRSVSFMIPPHGGRVTADFANDGFFAEGRAEEIAMNGQAGTTNGVAHSGEVQPALPYLMLTHIQWGRGQVRLLIVDDHGLFREGLKFLLRDLDRELESDEVGTCALALQSAARCQYDLVLLDLKLPGQSGLDALAALREANPTVPVVVLSGEDDPRTIRGAIERGAMGFIPKSSSRELLIQALRLVLANGVYLPPIALDAVDARIPGLTPRQTDVLRFVIQGLPNKLIARELGISDWTVKQHVSAVLRCLGAENRTEAVYAAAKLGLRLT
jgi:DNA-binding NarL/FixJ family response regulator